MIIYTCIYVYDDKVKRFNNTQSSHFHATKAMRYRIPKSALLFEKKNTCKTKQNKLCIK